MDSSILHNRQLARQEFAPQGRIVSTTRTVLGALYTSIAAWLPLPTSTTTFIMSVLASPMLPSLLILPPSHPSTHTPTATEPAQHRLPAELFDSILSFLPSSSLPPAALTCRALARRAESLLIASPSLLSSKSFAGVERIVKRLRSQRPHDQATAPGCRRISLPSWLVEQVGVDRMFDAVGGPSLKMLSLAMWSDKLTKKERWGIAPDRVSHVEEVYILGRRSVGAQHQDVRHAWPLASVLPAIVIDAVAAATTTPTPSVRPADDGDAEHGDRQLMLLLEGMTRLKIIQLSWCNIRRTCLTSPSSPSDQPSAGPSDLHKLSIVSSALTDGDLIGLVQRSSATLRHLRVEKCSGLSREGVVLALEAWKAATAQMPMAMAGSKVEGMEAALSSAGFTITVEGVGLQGIVREWLEGKCKPAEGL